jgi:hypothetical protein
MESKRKILYDTIEKSCIHFKHLNNKNKLIWLLNTDDNNILLELCKLRFCPVKCELIFSQLQTFLITIL